MPAPWTENALLVTSILSTIGTGQVLAQLPAVLKDPKPANLTNATTAVMGSVIGTALSYNYWYQNRKARIQGENAWKESKSRRKIGVKLGNLVTY